MNELSHLPGFRHDAKLIEETGKLKKFLFLHVSVILYSDDPRDSEIAKESRS